MGGQTLLSKQNIAAGLKFAKGQLVPQQYWQNSLRSDATKPNQLLASSSAVLGSLSSKFHSQVLTPI